MNDKSIRILYVDDYPLDRELVRDTLETEAAGFQIIEAATRADFEVRLAEGNYDLVLSDFNILGFQGLQVLDAVKAKDPNTPVIIVTGTGSEEVAAESMKRGATDYVIKTPEHIQRLPHTIHAAIEQYQLREERQRIEAALRESEARYRRLVQQSKDAIFLVGPDDKITFASPACNEIFGYEPEEFVNDPGFAARIVHPGYREQFEAFWHQYGTTGVFSEQPLEWGWIRKDGQTVYTENVFSNIFDEQGNIIGFQTLARDITTRKQADEALRESEARYRVLAEGTFEGIVISEKGVILDANPQFAQMYGYEVAELVGKPVAELVVPEDRELVISNIQTGFDQPYQHRAFRRDGTVIIVEVRGQATTYQGRPVRQTAIRDITERKQAEEEIRSHVEQLAALRATVLEIAAPHELSALLQAIVSRAARLLGASSGGLYLSDPVRQEVRCLVSYNTTRDFTGTVLKFGEGAAGRVVASGESLIIDDYRRWTGRASAFEADQPFRAVLSVPLKWQGQVVGVIHVLRGEEMRRFSQADLDLLRLFADHAAIAVENARLLDKLRQRGERLSILHEIDQAILTARSPEEIAQAALGHIRQLVPCTRASITMFDLDARVASRFAVGVAGESQIGMASPFPVTNFLRVEALRQGEVYLVEDILGLAQPTPLDRSLQAEGVRSYTNVPLIAQGKLIGSLNLGADSPGAFDKEQIGIASEVAASLAVAISSAQLLEEQRIQLGRESALLALARVVNSTLDLQEVMQTILNHLYQLVPYDSATVQLLEGDVLRTAAAAGFEDQSAAQSFVYALDKFPLNRQLIDDQQPIRIGQVQEDNRYVATPGTEKVQAFVGVPLLAKGGPVGVITIDAQTPAKFSERDVELAAAVAAHAAVAIENARLFESERIARQEAETLRAASLDLSQTLDLDAILEALLDYLGRLVPYDTADVRLAETASRMVVRATRGREGRAKTGLARGFAFEISAYSNVRTLFTTRQSLLIPDTHESPGWKHLSAADHVRSWLGVPLVAGGKVIGLYSMDKSKPGFFTEKHQHLAEALAAQGVVAIQNAQLFEQVREGRERLRALSKRLLEAQESERRHIALELHDQIGQSLTAVKIELQAVQRLPDASPPASQLEQCIAIVEGALQQVRHLALDLRPSMLDDLGLAAALRWYVDRQAQPAGMAVEFKAETGKSRPASDVETACYRVAQEALTNVVRHARADKVRLELRQDEAELHLVIQDDGAGFDVPAALARAARRGESLGLLGMQERVQLLEGRLEIDSVPGGGTTLQVHLPLATAPASGE